MTGMGEAGLDLTGARIRIVDDVPANLDVLAQALEEAASGALFPADLVPPAQRPSTGWSKGSRSRPGATWPRPPAGSV